MKVDYNKKSATYDNSRTHSDETIAEFTRIVRLTPETAVLDFGCGTGNYLSEIQNRFGSVCHGVEPSEKMRQIATGKNPNLNIVEGDHRSIPLAAASVHFAYMTDVVHHVPDLPTMFIELRRVMRPEGFICIATQSHKQIDGRYYNRYFPSLATIEKNRYPSIQRIITVADGSGFRVQEVATVPAPGVATINKEFIRLVEEKNYSMFLSLPDDEYETGLEMVRRDEGKEFSREASGTTYIWFEPR